MLINFTLESWQFPSVCRSICCPWELPCAGKLHFWLLSLHLGTCRRVHACLSPCEHHFQSIPSVYSMAEMIDILRMWYLFFSELCAPILGWLQKWQEWLAPFRAQLLQVCLQLSALIWSVHASIWPVPASHGLPCVCRSLQSPQQMLACGIRGPIRWA